MSDPPGTKWLKQAKRSKRDNPETMFTPQQNYERNRAWAKPGNYNTKLSVLQEGQFQQWLKQNNVEFDHTAPVTDYDMRGYWQALQAGDPRAASAIDPNDKQMHYPGYWKTPYSATFSNESQWAQPNAPVWKGDSYQLPNGHVIYDDKQGRWNGLPQ